MTQEISSADIGFVLWGGYDILGDLTNFNLGLTNRTEENTRLGMRFVRFGSVGVQEAKFDVSGFFDGGARSLSGAFSGLGDTRQAALFNLGDNALGSMCIGLEGGVIGQADVNPARGEFVKAKATATAVGIIDPYMKTLYPMTVVTGNVTATALNEVAEFPTPTAFGGILHVHVADLDLDGGTKLNILAESGDGATYASLTGGSKDFTVNGGFRIPVTGTVGTRVRIKATWTGGGANRTAKVAVGWVRLTA